MADATRHIDLSPIPSGDTPPQYQLRVRWRWQQESDNAGGTVHLIRDGATVIRKSLGCNDRVYGFCDGIVTLLQAAGHQVDMPLGFAFRN